MSENPELNKEIIHATHHLTSLRSQWTAKQESTQDSSTSRSETLSSPESSSEMITKLTSENAKLWERLSEMSAVIEKQGKESQQLNERLDRLEKSTATKESEDIDERLKVAEKFAVETALEVINMVSQTSNPTRLYVYPTMREILNRRPFFKTHATPPGKEALEKVSKGETSFGSLFAASTAASD